MDAQVLTGFVRKMEEKIMMNKQISGEKINILQETEHKMTKYQNLYTQNCKDDSGFIKWEQRAIKGSN